MRSALLDGREPVRDHERRAPREQLRRGVLNRAPRSPCRRSTSPRRAPECPGRAPARARSARSWRWPRREIVAALAHRRLVAARRRSIECVGVHSMRRASTAPVAMSSAERRTLASTCRSTGRRPGARRRCGGGAPRAPTRARRCRRRGSRRVDVVEPADQLDDRRLAGARGADDRQVLARRAVNERFRSTHSPARTRTTRRGPITPPTGAPAAGVGIADLGSMSSSESMRSAAVIDDCITAYLARSRGSGRRTAGCTG